VHISTIKKMTNIAIFASGSGTNAENIIRYFADSETIKVAVVLSNNSKAGVHERINRLGIPSFVFTRDEFTEATLILNKLAEYNVEFIVLAGFMNKISPLLLQAFPQRIINIHPALLPKFGGKGMYGMHVHEAIVAAGEKESGITIHYINENYDEGAIIFQISCPLSAADTAQDVASKIHVLEHAYYPLVIEELLSPLQH
jgi:phosphoribosylglycinamide formyltransferase-1